MKSEAPNLWLEPIALIHADAVQKLCTDAEVLRMTLLPEPYPEGSAAEWIRSALMLGPLATERSFAICTREHGVVGCCGISQYSQCDPVAEVGYWIGAPYRRRGYARAALLRLLTHLSLAYGLAAVRAKVHPENLASLRLLRSMGFREISPVPNPYTKWPAEVMLNVWELSLSDNLTD